ncbi:hypothetical protein VTK73DRAFT_9664 [Phialemonium thermophilum]|uniref:Phosphatidic acid phosphatase type 2/haloperoxidase domain-containing protein n=1 Tax=Phialemonium thermophilum TaxID=223376 RepID=A0ABR3XJZ4_9PEZI
MQEFNAFFSQPKPKLPFLWSGYLNVAHLNPIPHKFRPGRRLRSRTKSRSGPPIREHSVTRLQTSFNVLDSLRALRRRQWRFLDLQYLILLGFVLFCLVITPSAPLIKTGAVVAYAVLLLMPITRQFFLPSLPIWIYLLYFFSSRFIPTEFRPHIWVKVLPALENVLYGANLSNILSAHTHPVLDLLAWIPYGLGHFGLPVICSGIMFLFAAPGTTPTFAKAFGYMSLLGVVIQLTFPCTPPWYEKLHGLEPAHYGMAGSPAGLARVDKLLGVDMYTTSFTTAPLPFGAFPSLHSADATLEALFMQHCFPQFRYLFIAYAGWVWWATMYLNHHYAVDLVAGSLMACVTYYIVRARWLPRMQHEKNHRWEYEYVEYGQRPRARSDEEYGYHFGAGLGLGLLQRTALGDSDEWTIGSTSSFDSLSRGETTTGSSTSTPGCVSPTTPDDDFRHDVFGMTPQGDMWEAGRLARESELTEVVVMR